MQTKPMSRMTKRRFGPNPQKFSVGEAKIQQDMFFKEHQTLLEFLESKGLAQNKISRVINIFRVKCFREISRMKNSEFFNGKACDTELIKIRKDLECTYGK